jgi:hypothetical protein
MWISEHHRIPGNEQADKLAKEGTNGFPSDQTVGIRFAVSKEVIRTSNLTLLGTGHITCMKRTNCRAYSR